MESPKDGSEFVRLKLIQFGVLDKKKNTELGMKVTLFRMRDITTDYKVLKADRCHKYYKIEKNNISLLLINSEAHL